MMRQPEGSRQHAGEEERVKSETTTPVAKVVEIIGNSEKSFEDAVKRAVDVASRSIRHISGVEVVKQSVVVKDNRVAEYRVDLKLAFGIEAQELGHH